MIYWENSRRNPVEIFRTSHYPSAPQSPTGLSISFNMDHHFAANGDLSRYRLVMAHFQQKRAQTAGFYSCMNSFSGSDTTWSSTLYIFAKIRYYVPIYPLVKRWLISRNFTMSPSRSCTTHRHKGIAIGNFEIVAELPSIERWAWPDAVSCGESSYILYPTDRDVWTLRKTGKNILCRREIAYSWYSRSGKLEPQGCHPGRLHIK